MISGPRLGHETHMQVTDIINIKAQNRLKDKIKAYVKEKKD